jgi:hypothetical protein
MFVGCMARKEMWVLNYEAAPTSSDGAAGIEAASAHESSSSVSVWFSSAGEASKRLGGAAGSGFFSPAGAAVGVDGLLPVAA